MTQNEQIQQSLEKLRVIGLNIDLETVRQLQKAFYNFSAAGEQLSKASQSVFDRLGQQNIKVIANKKPYWRQFDNSK